MVKKTDKDKANASDQKKDDEKKPSFWENIKKNINGGGFLAA